MMLGLKFRSCFWVIYWALFNSFCLNSLSAARAVGERGPSPSEGQGWPCHDHQPPQGRFVLNHIL